MKIQNSPDSIFSNVGRGFESRATRYSLEQFKQESNLVSLENGPNNFNLISDHQTFFPFSPKLESESKSDILQILRFVDISELTLDSRSLNQVRKAATTSTNLHFSILRRTHWPEEELSYYYSECEYHSVNLLNHQFSNFKKIYSLVAPLENKVRNNYLKKLSRYNSLFKVGLRALNGHKKELDKLGVYYRPGQFYSNHRNVKNHLWGESKEALKNYNKFNKLKEQLDGIESCFRNCKANLNNFYLTGHIKLFFKAFNDLQTAFGKRVSLKNLISNYTFSKIHYYSRDKFCLISRKKRVAKVKDLLLSSLDYYIKFKNLRLKFFTVSPKNIELKDFTKENLLKYGHANFKVYRRRLSKNAALNVNINAYHERLAFAFMFGKLSVSQYHYNVNDLYGIFQEELRSRPSLSDYFKGYFGVPEIKENVESKTVNIHTHSIVLTEDEFLKSYVSKFYIEEVVKETFDIYGPECMKGSHIVDIRDKTRKGESDAQSAVNYILVDYFLKGVDIESDSFYEQVLRETEGIRFERSGGLLSSKNLKTNAVIHAVHTELEILNVMDLRMFTHGYNLSEHYNIGGKLRFDGTYYKEPYKLKIDKYVELRKTSEDVSEQVTDLLFNTFEVFGQTLKVKNEVFDDIWESMFGKTPFTCKFYSNPEKNKLSWDSLQEDEFESDLGDSSFISKALVSIGHQENKPEFISYVAKYVQNEDNIIFSEFDCSVDYESTLDEYISYLENNFNEVFA